VTASPPERRGKTRVRDRLSKGFSQFVTSVAAPVASGWSVCRVGFTPTGKAPPYHGAHPWRTPVEADEMFGT